MRAGGWTLRARLVAALLVLATVALATFGVASVLLIRKSQLDRVDAQLRDAQRIVDRPGMMRSIRTQPRPEPTGERTGDRGDLPTEFRLALFAPDGTLLGTLPRQEDNADAGGPALPRIDQTSYPGQSRQPFTVDDRADGASWRVRVVTTPQGMLAIAMSLETMETTIAQLLTIEIAVGSVVLVLLGTVGFAVVRLGLRPLTRIEHTATAIADGDLDRRVPDADPRTETGRLGGALNTMLGRLSTAIRQRERSEGRLRRFVADASHELRTPLTSIRGFAELYRRGGAAEESDVDRLMRRIEEEALRMGLLVEDLLLLARLDQQRSLERTEVDLTVLAGDAVHDVAAREPERPVRLCTPDGAVLVTGDEHRLRQVITNLVTNAVIHTPPKTPVTVTVRARYTANGRAPAAGVGAAPDSPALLEVRDAGDGIPAEAAPLVFDRFYRADPARSRRRGGTGLGLAITAAIVEAHDGRIELHSTPGSGATFRVLLPRG